MKYVYVVIISFLSVIGSLYIPTYQIEGVASPADFSVKAILPDNQKLKNVSYFDFELLPGMEQLIEIEVENNSQEEKTYNIEVNTATTNMNGVIDYTEVGKDVDSSLKIALSDISIVEPTVVIPAGEVVRIPIDISMPNQEFEGIMLGGITVYEQNNEDHEQQITNQFSYSIGISISQGNITPSIDLDLLDVEVEQTNRRNVISGVIQNSVATIVNDLAVEAWIYRSGEDNPLFHREETGLRMAPNSNFNFGVNTQNQPLRPGKYTMKAKATASDKNWEWSKEFEITAKQAKELNESAVEIETDNTAIYLWIAAALIIFLIVLVVILLVRGRRK